MQGRASAPNLLIYIKSLRSLPEKVLSEPKLSKKGAKALKLRFPSYQSLSSQKREL